MPNGSMGNDPALIKSVNDTKNFLQRAQEATEKKKGHYEFDCCGTKYWVDD